MPGHSSDRNLLVGIIALQMDFISRDALIAALHTWVLKKVTPLSQILQDQGALSAPRRSLLDALVEEHILLHERDPKKSLAALSSIGSVREELSLIADPELRASLPPVSAARLQQEPDDGPSRTKTASVGEWTSAGLRFRILRPHAKGGLGEVFVARDTELNRDVALKEIQDRFADDPRHRARFEFEAEITGGLEHPGIVPVYGLGHTADGRPFYAMRFIQGDSLKAAIRRFHEADQQPRRDPGERMLALRGLLGRFLDVCDAVAYAHGRGVLHRDLKPGNIMLGRYGQTLVVDWGLAKALDRPEEPASESAVEPPLKPASGSALEPTQAGSAVGTPAYMSPEQAEGRLDRLGTRSDVYCLGATLYHLLTGHAPCEAEEIGEVFQKVLAGDIPRPRTLNPRIAPALEAICKKAMARTPADRYESVEALRTDLERWLADEPVSAWREPSSIRARRWMRRHRSAVTAATATLIVGLAALGLGYWQLLLFNGRLSESNLQLRRAQVETNHRLDQTLHAIEDYYTGVSEDVLLGRKEFHDLRARLLEKPRQFYEQLTRELEAASDERGRSLLAKGRYGLGRLMWLLGRQGEAKRENEAAITLYRKLVAAQPDIPEYQDRLARSYSILGIVQRDAGDHDGAAESYREVVAIYSKLVAAQPDVAKYRDFLALGYNNLGNVQYETGDLKRAAESYRQAIAMRSNLMATQPNVPDYQHGLALSYNNLGNVQSDEGDRAGAAESYRQANATWSKLQMAQPNVPDYQDSLAMSYNNLGNVQSDTGDRAGAVESYRQAIAIRAKLVAAQPNVPRYRDGLAMTYNNLANVQGEMRQPQEAEETSRRAIKIATELVDANPDMPSYLSLLGEATGNLGAAVEAERRHADAEKAYRQAIDRQRIAVQKGPGVNLYRQRLSAHFSGLTRTLGAQGRADEAAEVARQRRASSKNNAAELYDAACGLALCVPISRDEARKGALAAEAVATLRAAIKAGWHDAAHTGRDTDLAPLHHRDDFRQLLAEMFDRGFPADPFARK